MASKYEKTYDELIVVFATVDDVRLAARVVGEALRLQPGDHDETLDRLRDAAGSLDAFFDYFGVDR